MELATHTIVFQGGWAREEPIHLLEGRAMLKAMEHAARTPRLRGCRVLFLGDNLSSILAFAKGRCRSFPLLVLCRRAAALALTFSLVPGFRHVRTHRNVADGPTRPERQLVATRPGDELTMGDGGFRKLYLRQEGFEENRRPPGLSERHF